MWARYSLPGNPERVRGVRTLLAPNCQVCLPCSLAQAHALHVNPGRLPQAQQRVLACSRPAPTAGLLLDHRQAELGLAG